MPGTRYPTCGYNVDGPLVRAEGDPDMKRAFALLILFVMVVGACTEKGAPPTFEPLPTTTIPPDFVVFTDELSLFSISYPSDWELDLASMEQLGEIVDNIIESKTSEVSLDTTGFVFFAGLPRLQGYDPNTTIAVKSLPGSMPVAEYWEASKRLLPEVYTGYSLNAENRVILGDKESMIVDYEFNASSVISGAPGKIRLIQSVTIDGAVGWSVACGVSSPVSQAQLQTCDAVVRSFRILQ